MRHWGQRGHGVAPPWHAAATGFVMLAGLGSVATAAAPGAPAASVEPLGLRRLVAACTVSMANNVCSVARNPSSSTPAVRAQPAVFVVGAGAVDRTAYAYLQDGGKAMCARAQSACRADWSGSVCTTARSLWAD